MSRIIIHAVTTNSIVSQVIRLFTFSEYSHVEFAVQDDTGKITGYLGALGSGGVQIRKADYDAWSKEAFFVTANLPDDIYKAVWQFAVGRIGDSYDWGALLGLGLRRDWRKPGSYFCSELVEAAFDSAGWPLLDDRGETDRITPRDIVLSPRLAPVTKQMAESCS